LHVRAIDFIIDDNLNVALAEAFAASSHACFALTAAANARLGRKLPFGRFVNEQQRWRSVYLKAGDPLTTKTGSRA
jgi:hypothetical protein